MAQSKLKNSRGLNIRSGKKRDKTAQASTRTMYGSWTKKDGKNRVQVKGVVKTNDGDPHHYYSSQDEHNGKFTTKKKAKRKDPKAAWPVNKKILGVSVPGAVEKKAVKKDSSNDPKGYSKLRREAKRNTK